MVQFCIEMPRPFVLSYARMQETDITCQPTRDTFVRFAIVLVAFFGFGLYFFYDGSVGYRKANEVFFSYQAFASLGQKVQQSAPASWKAMTASAALLPAVQTEDGPVIEGEKGLRFPLPQDCEATRSCPPEVQDYQAMSKGWNDCWIAYTGRMHYPARAGEHPYDEGAIREQWYAGGGCMVVSLLIVWLMLRTKGRVMSLSGDTVTAAGQQFRVADITRLDLRQWWGKGVKGIAYATVNGRKIKMDGMTYGGFGEKGTADTFMKALLEQYKGEILEYERDNAEKQ